MDRVTSLDDYDGEESASVDVVYQSADAQMVLTYTYEEFVNSDENITAYEYETNDGTLLYFDHENVNVDEAQYAYSQVMANETMVTFNFANASIILVLSFLIMMLFAKQFTTYEKCWFLSIMILATIFSVLWDSLRRLTG